MTLNEVISALIAFLSLIVAYYSFNLSRKYKKRKIDLSYEFSGKNNEVVLCLRFLNNTDIDNQITEIGLMTKRNLRISYSDFTVNPIPIKSRNTYSKTYYIFKDKEIINKADLITKYYVKDISGKLYSSKIFPTLEYSLAYFFISNMTEITNKMVLDNQRFLDTEEGKYINNVMSKYKK